MTTTTTTATPIIPAFVGIHDRLASPGEPLIRVTAGLLLMPHGAQKLFGWFGGYGLEGTAGFSPPTWDSSPACSGPPWSAAWSSSGVCSSQSGY
jgi:hypothetical protein